MEKNIMGIPSGTRDLFYNDCKMIECILKQINSIFNLWGYEEIITPTIEFYDTFTGYSKSINQKEMYKFSDSKGRIIALKADSTLPIARVVSSKLKDSKLPLRLRYCSRVFRVNEEYSGKRNEFIDCGIEFIGEDKYFSDIEAIVMGIQAIKESSITDFKLEIGHIGIIQRLAVLSKIDQESIDYISELIEGKKIVELRNFLANLDIDDEYKKIFEELPWLFGDNTILEKGKLLTYDKQILREINYLEKIYNDLKEIGFEKYISFDLGIAPRVNYYSGIVFRAYATGVGNYILHGGRYDTLMKSYGRELSAIGFSIRIDELIKIIDINKFLVDEKIQEVFYSDKTYINAIKKAEVKRALGKRVILKKESI